MSPKLYQRLAELIELSTIMDNCEKLTSLIFIKDAFMSEPDFEMEGLTAEAYCHIDIIHGSIQHLCEDEAHQISLNHERIDYD